MEPSGGRHRPWLGIFESLIRNVFLLADRKFKAVVAGVSRDSLYEIRNLFDNRPWRVSARFSLAPDLTIRQVR